MAYCTESDVMNMVSEVELIQLTDDPDSGMLDSDILSNAIADADAEINGYCGGRYRVPFSPVPAVIRKISIDITIYNVFSRRVTPPEHRKNRYDSAIRFLSMVAKGDISLGTDDPAGSETQINLAQMSTENPARTFTRTSMAGF